MHHRHTPPGFLLFSFIILIVLLVGHTVSAQDNGRITVTIVNQTTNETLAGQDVDLLRHMDETEDMQRHAEGKTDRSGRYSFTGLPVGNAHYAVSTRYLDVDYTSEHLTLQGDTKAQTLQLGVYNKTAEETAIFIEAHHIVVEATPEALNVTEILVFQNTGNETFAPLADTRLGLRLSLPPAASQVHPLSGGIEADARGLLYTPPVPPGPVQIIYAYSVDRRSSNDLVSKFIEYDTDRIQVMTFPSDQTVTGTGLAQEGIRQIGDKSYLLLNSTAKLTRGMTLDIQFPSLIPWQDIMKWGSIGLIVLMVIVGVIFGRKMREVSPPAPAMSSSSEVSEEQEDEDLYELLQMIADLDDQLEAGAIDQKTYRRRRKDLKDQAIHLEMTEDADE